MLRADFDSSSSNVATTQLETLLCIINLSTTLPLLQVFFRNLSGEKAVSDFITNLKTSSYISASSPQFDEMLLAARRAMVCIGNNDISELAKGMYRSSRVRISLSERKEQESDVCVAELSNFTRHSNADFAFVATAHLNNWLRFVGEELYSPYSTLDELIRHGSLFRALASLVRSSIGLSEIDGGMLDSICFEILEQFKYVDAFRKLKPTAKDALLALVSTFQTPEIKLTLPSASSTAEMQTFILNYHIPAVGSHPGKHTTR
ncbi:hypothetical protein EW145_g3362 [Phellinidium pouzarii]|uniref:Uncharacterized protein n=1 Tax=Phellinidium pouzarii TaxID=167371 RepID=A0A4V6S178_9AGAM|nr:hypothetical protein EW145_g3362 [Phellinidium pouzarii]